MNLHRSPQVSPAINDKNLNSEIETIWTCTVLLKCHQLSMIRISILRLKRFQWHQKGATDRSSINDKNLNSEIETTLRCLYRPSMQSAINDKNLNSEIETTLRCLYRPSMQSAINDKNLNSEIETCKVLRLRDFNVRLSMIRISILRLKRGKEVRGELEDGSYQW